MLRIICLLLVCLLAPVLPVALSSFAVAAEPSAGSVAKTARSSILSRNTDLKPALDLLQNGDYAAGREQLLPLINQPFSRVDSQRLFNALIEANLQLQRPLDALVFFQRLLPFSEQPARELARVHHLLQSRLSEAQLAEAAFMWAGTVIGQDARLQLARRALGRQDRSQARELLQLVLASPVTFPYWQEAEQLYRRTESHAPVNRDRIGVLLPLSGRYASYGELVKKGLELALQQYNQSHQPIRFTYLDTGIEGVTASQLVSRLSDDEKVMAIIGPLTGAVAEDAAYRAQRDMVPLLTLSQREGLPQTGNFVFRDSLTPRAQVQTLVQYAMAAGNISFSVLHPENRLGNEMTRLFVSEVESLGGEMVDIVSYPEDATDFRRQIKKLLWENPDQSSSAGSDGEQPELEYPLPPFHALFIPDYAERVGLLAPQLVFYGLKEVTLLGINGWNSPELTRRAGRFLQQAVFVDGFFPDSRNPVVQRFVESYRQTYQEEPTILQAQAFDVANLLLGLLADPGIRNRDDLRQALATFHDFRGVTGTSGFDAEGEVIKQLSLLKVKRGRAVEID